MPKCLESYERRSKHSSRERFRKLCIKQEEMPERLTTFSLPRGVLRTEILLKRLTISLGTPLNTLCLLSYPGMEKVGMKNASSILLGMRTDAAGMSGHVILISTYWKTLHSQLRSDELDNLP